LGKKTRSSGKRPQRRQRRWSSTRPICEILEDRTTPSMIWGDFNGDGFMDLAVGNPYATVNGIANAGQVTVYYGSASGISTANKLVLTQSTVDPTLTVESGDMFGWSLAAGDFKNNGYDDLVIGSPYNSLSGAFPGAGIVNIVFGSANGLNAAGSQLLFQGSGPGAQHRPHIGDLNGYSVVVGDFNGDGYLDLAESSPGNRAHLATHDILHAGIVLVYYGGPNGLTNADTAYSLGGSAQANDYLGWSLAVGDFNGDGIDDVAAGIPNRTVNGVANAGAVAIWFGTPTGLGATSSGRQIFYQGVNGIQGTPQTNGNFGWSVAAGDFNGDGFSDLAVGAPGDNSGAGTVNVIYGSANRLTKTGNQLWTQDTLNDGAASQAGAGFGTTLVAADFNGDGKTDLAIGAPDQAVNGMSDAGAIDVLYGVAGHFSAAGSQFWTQDSLNNGLASQANGQFGSSLAAGDGNGDHFADLAIEAPGEAIAGVANADPISVMYGSIAKLQGTGNQSLYGGPAAPLNVRADTVLSFSSVELEWNQNGTDATGYEIERSLDGINFTVITTTGANATSYIDTGLNANTIYYYRIRAVNAAGQSLPVTVETYTGIPPAPSNLQVSKNSSGAKLTWTDNSVNETGFNIFRSTDGVNFVQVGWVPPSTTTFTDTTVTTGTTYSYQVQASGTLAPSGFSNTVTITM
jgi:hypothetical protein